MTTTSPLSNEPAPGGTGRIYWTTRYSSTDDDDKRGRWARVGYIAHQESEENFGYIGTAAAASADRDRPKSYVKATFQVAWIEKFPVLTGPAPAQRTDWDGRVVVRYAFPSDERSLFDSLAEAQQHVEQQLDWFLACCEHTVDSITAVTSQGG